jgi:hypothetical protein
MQKVADVLARLRDERAKLLVELAGVDRAIAALEEVLGSAPAPVSMPPPMIAGPYASAGSLYEAVADYLTEAGEPRTSRQIAEALQAGGYPTTALNFPATVRTMLLRTEASQPYGIRKTTTGHRWCMED